MLVDGAPAILIDTSSATLIAALAGKVCYREATNGLEKVTADQIVKRHPRHDAFMAASYLLLGGAVTKTCGRWCQQQSGQAGSSGERGIRGSGNLWTKPYGRSVMAARV
jgi:hypothetical protein